MARVTSGEESSPDWTVTEIDGQVSLVPFRMKNIHDFAIRKEFIALTGVAQRVGHHLAKQV